MNCPMCGELWNNEKCQSCGWIEPTKPCLHAETFRSRDGRRCCECRAWIPGSFGIPKKTTLLLLLLCVPVGSQAQSLNLPTTVFASAAVVDWASTYVAVSRYHLHEDNPMINYIHQPTLMIGAGAALDVAGVAAWNHWIGRSHRRIAAIGLYAAAAWRIYLVQSNVRQSVRIARKPSFWSGGIVGIK